MIPILLVKLMSEEKKQLRIFLCHASADKSKVRDLYRYLKRRGIQPWFDAEDLIPGQNWQVEIPKALNTSDAIIVCLTTNAVDKEGYIQKEIKYALDKALEMPEGRIFLIPARFEECEVPYSLKEYQWVDLFEVDGYAKLMKSLKLRASQLHRADVEARNPSPPLTTWQAEGAFAPIQITESDKKPVVQEEVPVPDIKITESQKPGERPLPRKSKVNLFAFLTGAIIIIICLSSLGGIWLLPKLLVLPPAITATFASPVTATFIPPTQTPTIAFSPTMQVFNPAPNPSDYMDGFGVPMRRVSNGDFLMGDNNGGPDEEPLHTVHLDLFYIDKYEVTNALYKICVDAGVCQLPKKTTSYSQSSYYGNSTFDNYPVIFVDWNMAKTYCEWRGARLPTEAEWEKTARGTKGQDYPWGFSFNGNLANFCDKNCTSGGENTNYDDGFEDTAPVGTYEGGVSPFGAYEMAGNVKEWVSDFYSEDYYLASPISNPLGPNLGVGHVVHGGAWCSESNELMSQNRSWEEPEYSGSCLGFRCAISPP